MTWIRIAGILAAMLGIAVVVYSFSQTIFNREAAGIGTINLITVCPGVLFIVFGLIVAILGKRKRS